MAWSTRRMAGIRKRYRTPRTKLESVKSKLDREGFRMKEIRLNTSHWVLPDGSIYGGDPWDMSFAAFPGKINLAQAEVMRDQLGIISMWVPKGGNPVVSVPQRPTEAQMKLIEETMSKYQDNYIFNFPDQDPARYQNFHDLKMHYFL